MRHRLEYFGLRLAQLILAVLPREWAYRLADALAYLAEHGVGIRREVVLENLERAFPDASKQRHLEITTDCYRFYSRALVDLFRVDDVLAHDELSFEGWDQVIDHQGSGAILASAHLGHQELGAMKMGEELGQFTIYADQQRNPYTDEYINRIRREHNVTAVSGAGGVRTLTRRVDEGQVVGIAGDQRPRNQPVEVPFFGHLVKNTRVLSFVARKSQAPVLPSVFVREGEWSWRLRVGRALPASTEEVTSDNMDELLKQYNRWLEDEIKNYPEQYFWFHRRWKDSTPISGEGTESP
jgi:KDO2-lipid IV(A) lauroyltransferase